MARAPRITIEYLKKLIASGAGSGHGENYRPFLEIRRWNPSPVSTQVVGGSTIPPYRRRCHFFSISEWKLALLYSWAGALVREQYPLWPWPHPHPLAGVEGASPALRWSNGLWAVCQQSGVKHGSFPGTRIPYIWTIDLALTLPWECDLTRACTFISVKPLGSEAYRTIDPLARGPEKLEIERRYAESMGISYFVADSSLYPAVLLHNLDWLNKAAFLPVREDWKRGLSYLLDTLRVDMANHPPLEWRARLNRDLQLPNEAGDYLIQHCLWHQHFDVDLNSRIDFSKPLKAGGHALRTAIRKSLQKEAICQI
jgi:hypothetical protein